MTRFLNIIRKFTNSITVNSIILITIVFIILNNVQSEININFNSWIIIKLIQHCICCNKNYHIEDKCEFKFSHLKRERKKRKKRKQKNFKRRRNNKRKNNKRDNNKSKNDDREDVNATFVVFINAVVTKFIKSFIYFVLLKIAKFMQWLFSTFLMFIILFFSLKNI